MNNDMMLPPDQVLARVLDEWKAHRPIGREIPEAILQYLSEDFNHSIFAINTGGFHEVSGALVTGSIAKVIAYENGSNDPFLAVLARDDQREWKLKRFLYVCNGCFGLGILSTRMPCNVCGGTGWGILGDLEFCVSPVDTAS